MLVLFGAWDPVTVKLGSLNKGHGMRLQVDMTSLCQIQALLPCSILLRASRQTKTRTSHLKDQMVPQIEGGAYTIYDYIPYKVYIEHKPISRGM